MVCVGLKKIPNFSKKYFGLRQKANAKMYATNAFLGQFGARKT